VQAKPSRRRQLADSSDRTFTETARRAQIVQAAIEVLAEVGYAKASFARIARQAGLSSTGIISYHFADRDDLMREVVEQTWRICDDYVRPRVEAQITPSGRLRAYIESYMALLSEFPRHLPAMCQVERELEQSDWHASAVEAVLSGQQERMREAQQSGHFRQFDTRVMALAIRGALYELINRAIREPDLDPVKCGQELADVFDLATRAMPPDQGNVAAW
jgi:AcrR family transcriptional regulator